MNRERFEKLKIKAHELPLVPGVYLMRDEAGTVIYVGKAKALKNRVSQYFANLASHTPKTRRMVENIYEFETIFAKTEFQALLLENTLIKKYKPKYNILLKDDKGYPFVRLSPGDYGRFSVVSRPSQDGARYFGPYSGRGMANKVIELVQEAFRLPTCTRQFPRDIGKERPCLSYHLNKCCAVCSGNVTSEQYGELIRQASMLLDGKSDGLEEALQRKMEDCAKRMEFENAALYRDRLRSVQKLGQSQVVLNAALSDLDVMAYRVHGARACIALLSYAKGSLVEKKTTFFDGLEESDASDALESFIKQYYGRVTRAPQTIYLSHEIEDKETIEGFLSSLRGRKSQIIIPQRGDKRKLIDLAQENAQYELAALEVREQKSLKTLELLADMLGLDAPPERIEAYDISNTAGADAVGSMTVFVHGAPKKGAYKKYKIKEAAASDDYGAMAEVLGRRFDRALSGDEGFLPLPDLLLIDGGMGQTGVVRREMESRGLNIPLFGMVKDSHHRTRALVTSEGREIGINTQPPVFSFIGRIQEETHRFAVTFHQDLRGKSVRRSALDGIPNVGESRKKQLLKAFGTISAIRQASVEQLAQVVPRPAAEAVYQHFAGEKQQHESDHGNVQGQAAAGADGPEHPADDRPGEGSHL